MAHISKHVFDTAFESVTCRHIVHIKDPSCLTSGLAFLSGCFKGISCFFFLMYAAQYLIMRKKQSKESIKRIAKDYIRSVMFGMCIGTAARTNLCLHSNLLGKLNYYFTAYGTGLAIGVVTILSPKSRLPIEATYFSIMTLECLIRYFAFRDILPKSKQAGTPLFMICNGLMMYLLWKQQNSTKKFDIPWIFKPYSNKEQSDNKLCSHKGYCLKDCLEVSLKYFLIGGGISALKFLIKFYNNKEKNALLNKSYLEYPLFLGCYVGLHKAVHCLLTNIQGKDRGQFAFIAGLVSGMTYLIQPSLSLASSSTVLLIKALLADRTKNLKINIPYISMAISFSVLTHFFIVNKKLVPSFFTKMFSLASNKWSDGVIAEIQHIVNSYKLAKI